MSQPAQLASPTELIVVGDESLEILQGYTRSRADLVYALDHLPAALPFKKMRGVFFWSGLPSRSTHCSKLPCRAAVYGAQEHRVGWAWWSKRLLGST